MAWHLPHPHLLVFGFLFVQETTAAAAGRRPTSVTGNVRKIGPCPIFPLLIPSHCPQWIMGSPQLPTEAKAHRPSWAEKSKPGSGLKPSWAEKSKPGLLCSFQGPQCPVQYHSLCPIGSLEVGQAPAVVRTLPAGPGCCGVSSKELPFFHLPHSGCPLACWARGPLLPPKMESRLGKLGWVDKMPCVWWFCVHEESTVAPRCQSCQEREAGVGDWELLADGPFPASLHFGPLC